MNASELAELIGVSEVVAIGGALVSMAGALIAALIAAQTSQRLATARSREERRNFCLHLQQQFDSPEFFQCRYRAWQKLNDGDFNAPIKLSELLRSEHWTPEVSTTIHFFESLNRYCSEGLIDEELAAKLFGRTYAMWWQHLIGRIEVDEAGEPYRKWLEGVQALHARVVRASDQTPVPMSVARPAQVG